MQPRRQARAMRFACTLGALMVLVASGAGCTRRATQLVVVVETDLVAGTDYQCFGVLVSRLEASGAVEPGSTRRFLAVPGEVTAPFSFGVTPPDGDPRRRVEVAVEALDRCADPSPTDRIVRRAARTGFLAEQSLRLPLYLPASCGDGCTVTESCPAVGPDCVPVPVVEPAGLAPVDRGAELLDAGVPLDASRSLDDVPLLIDAPPLGDANLPATCTTVRASMFGGLMATDFAITPREATAGWRVFWSTDSSMSVLDDPGGAARGVLTTPPTTMEPLLPFAAVATGPDDIQLFGTIEGRTGVSRWWGPSYDTVVTATSTGALRTGGQAVPLETGEVLVLTDEGPGARNTLVRLPALTGSTVSLGPVAPDDRSVVLARRAGGALAVITGGTGACEVIPLAADGSPGRSFEVPVVGVCARVGIADLTGTVAVLAHVSGPASLEQAIYQLVDVSTAEVQEPVSLGRALPSRIEVLRNTVTAGFRVVWQDDTALSSMSFSFDGVIIPGARHCILDVMGATPDFATFRAAQRGGTTAVMFQGGTRGGLVYAEVSEP